MRTQPEALRYAEILAHPELRPTDFECIRAAAELRRLSAVNAVLLAALRDVYMAAPSELNCAHFHHGHSARHSFDEECKPAADYLGALSKARAAIAAATPAAPSTQPAKD